MANPRVTIAAPERQARKGGIYSVVTPSSEQRLFAARDIDWENMPCGIALATAAGCYSPDFVAGVDEVQSVTITGAPTGGTFRLTFNGQQTAAIAYNATAADVEAALRLLPGIGDGGVTVSGGPGPATPYAVTFTGALGDANQPQMTASHTFTGGTTPAIAVATTTAGVTQTKTLGSPEGYLVGPIPIFGAYIGVECFAHSLNDFEATARAGLENGEDRLIEAKLAAWFTASGAPIAVSEGGVAAIAKADQYADGTYAGLPVIHVNREDAVTLSKAGAFGPNGTSDGRLWTANGTPVVASAAYTKGVIAVTGAIGIVRSDIVANTSIHPFTNKQMALAERAFGVAVDCNLVETYSFTTA